MTPDAREPWLDDLREGVLLIEDGRVTYLNYAATELLQVDRERAVGKPLIAVARDHRIERAWLDQVTVELGARSRRLVVRPIRGGLGLEDVSSLRAREEEARDLLAVLSHELRTPVTTIQSTLEALEEDLPVAQRARFVARARQEGARLVRLLEDLTVDVAPPRARRVRLSEVADRARSLLAPLLASRSVDVVLRGLDADVWMDPDKALQIVLNLLENAALHGPRDSTVAIAAEAPDGGAHVVVTVRDRGTPLDPTAFEPLFAPRRRAGTGTSAGSGLGLYIVRSVAERAGGRAWGRPLPDGNAFSVALPRPAGRQDGGASAASES